MARGDVLLVNLPISDKREQSGRRPVVAVQTDLAGEPLLMIAPVTSNLNALRFAFSIRVEPSAENGLTMPSVVMIFQMRAIDKERIFHKVGQLSSADMARVDVVFPAVKANCAVELTEQILLSFNRIQSQAAGLTILDFSRLTAPTAFGPRSFALSGLDQLPKDLQEIVSDIITQPPVNYFLKLVSFQTNSGQVIPLTYTICVAKRHELMGSQVNR